MFLLAKQFVPFLANISTSLFAAPVAILNTVSSKSAAKSSRNLPDCIILEIWVCDNSIVADELYEKVLQSLATCLSVSNNSLYGKLFW